MPTDRVQNPYRPLIVAGALLVLVAILAYAQKVLIPIALGILLSFILSPAVSWLQARGLRRNYAVLLVVTATLLLLAAMVAGLTMQLRDLASDLPKHEQQIREKIKTLTKTDHEGIMSRLTRMLTALSKEAQGEPDHEAEKIQVVRIQPEKVTAITLVPVLAGPLWATLGKIGLTLALTTSMLLMREDLRNRVLLLLGDVNVTSTTRAMDDASRRISRYLITALVLNASFGTLFGIGLALMGVPYALVWGVLAAVLRFIPYIGTWMAAAFPVLVSLALEGWMQPVLVIGWCLLLGMLTNSLFEPLLVSRSTGVTPIALVVSAAFWTWLWGPIGLVLATPLTVCLSVLGKYVPSLRFFDILLGGTAAPLEPEVKLYQRLLARDEAEASELIEEYLKDHTSEELVDQVIVPALRRAEEAHERGHLSKEELSGMVKTVRELLDVAFGEQEVEGDPRAPLVLGCAAHHEVDLLVLELFRRMLDSRKARLEIVSSEATAAEVVAQVGQEQPALVLVGLVPPGGGARARYLCKKLRAKYPKLPIVTAVWGAGDPGPLGMQLLAAGASEVAGSLAATRSAITPLLQVVPQVEAVMQG